MVRALQLLHCQLAAQEVLGGGGSGHQCALSPDHVRNACLVRNGSQLEAGSVVLRSSGCLGVLPALLAAPSFCGPPGQHVETTHVDLLWGHATESRAYLLRIQNDPEHAARVEEVRDAIGLTESIAQRLRLDAALVLRVAGVELTIAQFTAIASLLSTGAAFAALKYVDWPRLLQRMTIFGA